MAITSVIQSGIIVISADESATIDELISFITEQYNDWTEHHILWDLTKYNFNPANSGTVQSAVEKLKSISPDDRSHLKRAVLVNSELGFGMSRMLQSFADRSLSIKIMIFKEREEAIEWLNS